MQILADCIQQTYSSYGIEKAVIGKGPLHAVLVAFVFSTIAPTNCRPSRPNSSTAATVKLGVRLNVEKTGNARQT